MSIRIAGSAPGGAGVDVRSYGTRLIASPRLTEWFRAEPADVTVSGGLVSQLSSRKVSSRNAAQASSTYQASLVAGIIPDPDLPGTSYSVLRFGAAQSYGVGGGGTYDPSQPYTWAFLFKPDVHAADGFLLGNWAAAAVRSNVAVTPGGYFHFYHGNAQVYAPCKIGAWNIGIIGHDGVSAFMELNGVSITAVPTDNATTTNQLVLGAFNNVNAQNGFDGDLADVFLMSGSPSACADEVDLIKSYAERNYGLA